MTWQWKAIAVPQHADVRSKIQDYAARIYVLLEQRRAIGYLWDSNAPISTKVTKRSSLLDRRLLVLRSGEQDLGVWLTETRDVLADVSDLFGGSAVLVRGISIETDSEDADHGSEVLIGSITFHD